MLTREQALETIKSQIETYLERKGINTSKPFKCLNPEHNDSKPSMSLDRKRHKVHCFACNADYDTLDLIGLDTGLKGKDLFAYAYDFFHLQVEGYKQDKQSQAYKDGTPPAKKPEKPAQAAEEYPDQTEFFVKCRARISETDYPERRGLSKTTVERFGLGYCPDWRHPSVGKNVPTSPRLIIPTGPCSYLARDVRAVIPAEAEDYKKQKFGPTQLFNLKALTESEGRPVFIVEGELDCMSVYEAGGIAVGLGSTSNAQKLLDHIEKLSIKAPLILALDNDTGGEKTADFMAGFFLEKHIAVSRFNISNTEKDPSAALEKDRTLFFENVKAAERHAIEVWQSEYMKHCLVNYLEIYNQHIAESAKRTAIPTGFKVLDELLDGGLYPGLVIAGGESSLGKTSFIWQIADQVAAAGHDVLFFTLEQSRDELIAKSVSRNSYLLCKREKLDERLAKSARGVLDGKRRLEYSQEEKTLLTNAFGDFIEHTPNMFLIEGTGEVGVNEIRETIQQHILFRGRRPLVFIDYLQVMKPENEKQSDKQVIDFAVSELRRITRDCQVPIFCLSSLNRTNYHKPVDYESFKETGAIEYSADVLLGLDYSVIFGKKPDEAKEAIAKVKGDMKRSVSVHVLKNRNGKSGLRVLYEFCPIFNNFEEQGMATL